MAAHQAPPSLGFSKQEYWSGLPFPSPVHESEVTQSCLTLRDPMDCSLSGSSIHVIFQARVLEWGAIGIVLFKNILGLVLIYVFQTLGQPLKFLIKYICYAKRGEKMKSLN